MKVLVIVGNNQGNTIGPVLCQSLEEANNFYRANVVTYPYCELTAIDIEDSKIYELKVADLERRMKASIAESRKYGF